MISVIVPMYNSRETIIRALDSVKNQTEFKKISEIIVINDGSTDDSLQILRQYANENKDMPIIIINKLNGGVSSARNAGLKVAKYDWIALLDSDDEWLPNKTSLQLEAIKKYPDIDFIGGNANNKKLRILWKKVDKIYKANIKDLCLKCFPTTSTALFKRSIIDKIGLFDESQKYGEDMNYFNKICLNFNYYHLPAQIAICDGMKTMKFHTGLSKNLKEMHKGNVKNIKELRERKEISYCFYLFLRFFYFVKYLRRIVLMKFC